MISANLLGRLGNSMFQIAASIGYARKYGYEWAVQNRPHNNESPVHRVFPNLPRTNERGLTLQEHPNKICNHHNQHYDLCHFNYHDLPNKGDNIFLSGFWQSWKYFEHCKEEVKDVFKLPHIGGYEDYVSIHVRRGDYVLHSGSFPPITIEYLKKSAGKFFYHHPNKWLVFSDDIKWCKENMSDWTGIEFSEGRNELEDLSLMASCGHHIIANSSFSWWGSYLGHNPNRIVISPSAETWFGPTSGVKQPVVDLILPEWTQIHTR